MNLTDSCPGAADCGMMLNAVLSFPKISLPHSLCCLGHRFFLLCSVHLTQELSCSQSCDWKDNRTLVFQVLCAGSIIAVNPF